MNVSILNYLCQRCPYKTDRYQEVRIAPPYPYTSPLKFLSESFIVLDPKLLEILVCPVSKAPLEYQPDQQELVCRASGLAYPIRDDIPVMLESEARALSLEERER